MTDPNTKPQIDFWYEFASTYSYLAVMRVETLARTAGVNVRWRPFLLGPIFAAQGWSTSPFNLQPAKGAYMWRDVEREAARIGLSFQKPDPVRGPAFPQNGLLAARLAIVGHDEGWGAAFTREAFKAQFAHGRDISNRDVLRWCLYTAGTDSEAALDLATTDKVKAALRAETEAAQQRGIFGAPSFTTTSGELFWGNDRLEQALSAAHDEAAAQTQHA